MKRPKRTYRAERRAAVRKAKLAWKQLPRKETKAGAVVVKSVLS